MSRSTDRRRVVEAQLFGALSRRANLIERGATVDDIAMDGLADTELRVAGLRAQVIEMGGDPDEIEARVVRFLAGR